MRRVTIRVAGRTYPVVVMAGGLAQTGTLLRDELGASEVLVVTDRTVDAHHGKTLRRSFARAGIKVRCWSLTPPGEGAKSLGAARTLYRAWLEAGADRSTPVVALGGGVVGDLAGFAASTYHRGLPLVHLPTTVISQVDSSIGGKTAVNFGGLKNLIGTYHQPDLVLSDPALLSTLSNRDYRAGLVEAVKVGVTLRPGLLDRLERESEAVVARDPEFLAALVGECAQAKGEVVGRDERDQDVRAILNYGHTVGHAVEAAFGGRLRHGEAVAVGMSAAAWVGEALGVSTGGVRERQDALLGRLGLKLSLPGADKGLILRNLKLDKKVRGTKTRFVLTLQVGGASVWPHISSRLLRAAVGVVTSAGT